MNSLIPIWIIGASSVGILILSFSFRGQSAMGGSIARQSSRVGDADWDASIRR